MKQSASALISKSITFHSFASSVRRQKRYEFGCKVGIAATNREGLFLAAMAFEGNPYDAHTLKTTAAESEEITGVAIQRLYADKDNRGS